MQYSHQKITWISKPLCWLNLQFFPHSDLLGTFPSGSGLQNSCLIFQPCTLSSRGGRKGGEVNSFLLLFYIQSDIFLDFRIVQGQLSSRAVCTEMRHRFQDFLGFSRPAQQQSCVHWIQVQFQGSFWIFPSQLSSRAVYTEFRHDFKAFLWISQGSWAAELCTLNSERF